MCVAKSNTLYEIIVEILKKHGKTLNDIIWIGCKDFRISLDDFVEFSKKIDECPGDAPSEVPIDLILVGNNFWIERIREWEDLDAWMLLQDSWRYVEYPTMPKELKEIHSLNIKESKWSRKQMMDDMGVGETGYFEAHLRYLVKDDI